MIRLFLLGFAVSLGVAYLILRFEHVHGRFTRDTASPSSHKVHRGSVSRIGGISIFAGWVVSLIASGYHNLLSFESVAIWSMCLLPAFVGGLAEDFTKRVPPSTRLFAAFLSAALAFMLLDVAVSRVDLHGIDTLLTVPFVAFVFTCFAIGGVAHAINIIDGLNGLASGVCLVALLALGYVAFEVGDSQLVLMCGLGAGATLGFRAWNYPSGRIFCGDGGAYFLGAYVAIVSALLIQRHQEVSAWFPLLLVIYPVWETVFSAYRRRILCGRPASRPDKLHMHTLFYKRAKPPMEEGKKRARRNSDASVSMMLLAAGGALPAVLWWSDGLYLVAAAFAYVLVYLSIYRRLVRFGGKVHKRPVNVDGHVVRRLAALHRSASVRRALREGNKSGS